MRAGKTPAVIFTIVFFVQNAEAAFEEKLSLAKEAFLGGAYAAYADAKSSLIKNPASVSFKESISASFSQSELFSIDGLVNQYLNIIIPTKRMDNWAVSFSQFGPDIYQEKEIALSCALNLSEGFSLGFAVKNERLKIRNYGSADSLSLDAGFISELIPNFYAGVCARNAVCQDIGRSGEKPRRIYRLGLSCVLSGYLSSFADIEKNFIDESVIYHLGQEINIADVFNFGFGWESNPGRFGAGIETRTRLFAVGYALLTHPYLEMEHHFSVSYYFNCK